MELSVMQLHGQIPSFHHMFNTLHQLLNICYQSSLAVLLPSVYSVLMLPIWSAEFSLPIYSIVLCLGANSFNVLKLSTFHFITLTSPCSLCVYLIDCKVI